ncbi:NAD(P)H-binding protein [Campylobacter sp. MIT 12-5580]|uniref:NAD(P)H-binding protein n=1 Tax=Campylobacter sp. MIT 12-5580 TaxID=2040651 RepID=UPI001BB1E752|nr:NAD(P)H-binding protein [Campylobacter sp. MIT 12-5580]
MKESSRRKFLGKMLALGAFASLGSTKLFANLNEAKTILILGANGRIARLVSDRLLKESKVNLRLFLRKASRLNELKSARVELFEGDASDEKALEQAMQGVDIVYANLSGDLELYAQNIITTMQNTNTKRLIWISSVGVYNEVSEYELRRLSPWLGEHKKSVELIEASKLDYTIIRPGWLSNENSINYALTQKGQDFINPEKYISRASVADLIVKICLDPKLYIRASLGIHKP